MVSRLVALLSFLLLIAFAVKARAQERSPIRSNNYNVEFFQGPVLAPLRVTGLAGAYAGYAEGVDGIPSNAASSGVRFPSSFDMFDYDLSFSLSFPAAFRSTDFDNDGTTGFVYDDFLFATIGGMLQWGPAGIGVLSDIQRYEITPKQGDIRATAALFVSRTDITLGWALWDNQLVLGAGPRILQLDIRRNDKTLFNETLLDIGGVAPQFGILIRPNYKPWRLGVNYRTMVRGDVGFVGGDSTDESGVRRAAGLIVPTSIYSPWEIRAGFSLQLGPRPLNPRWVDPVQQHQAELQRIRDARVQRARTRHHQLQYFANPVERAAYAARIDAQEADLQRRENALIHHLSRRLREQRRQYFEHLPREYLLVVAEALVTGPTPRAVSLESFLGQHQLRAGMDTTITPRLGLEAEPVIGYLKTRLGTYVEPSRFRGRTYRQHVTFGFDFRLFRLPAFWIFSTAQYRVSGMLDLAPRYQNFGFSFGTWY